MRHPILLAFTLAACAGSHRAPTETRPETEPPTPETAVPDPPVTGISTAEAAWLLGDHLARGIYDDIIGDKDAVAGHFVEARAAAELLGVEVPPPPGYERDDVLHPRTALLLVLSEKGTRVRDALAARHDRVHAALFIVAMGLQQMSLGYDSRRDHEWFHGELEVAFVDSRLPDEFWQQLLDRVHDDDAAEVLMPLIAETQAAILAHLRTRR